MTCLAKRSIANFLASSCPGSACSSYHGVEPQGDGTQGAITQRLPMPSSSSSAVFASVCGSASEIETS